MHKHFVGGLTSGTTEEGFKKQPKVCQLSLPKTSPPPPLLPLNCKISGKVPKEYRAGSKRSNFVRWNVHEKRKGSCFAVFFFE